MVGFFRAVYATFGWEYPRSEIEIKYDVLKQRHLVMKQIRESKIKLRKTKINPLSVKIDTDTDIDTEIDE
jgi:hypothetical protein